MFAIVTSALTGALVVAPATSAAADPIKAVEPIKKQLSTQDVPATAAAALEETSDLFGNLGRDLEETLDTGANLSTELGRTTSDPLNTKTGSDPLSTKTVADPLNTKTGTDPLVTKAVNDPLSMKKEDVTKQLVDRDIETSLSEASRLSRLVGRTAESLVNGVDDVIGSID